MLRHASKMILLGFLMINKAEVKTVQNRDNYECGNVAQQMTSQLIYNLYHLSDDESVNIRKG